MRRLQGLHSPRRIMRPIPVSLRAQLPMVTYHPSTVAASPCHLDVAAHRLTPNRSLRLARTHCALSRRAASASEVILQCSHKYGDSYEIFAYISYPHPVLAALKSIDVTLRVDNHDEWDDAWQ